MPEPHRPSAATGDDEATASADGRVHQLEVFAISPAIGPLPAIYVPQSPRAKRRGLARQAEAQAARREEQ